MYADYASLMGRAAAHTNQIVTWDEVTNSKFQFCDYLDDLNYDSPPPVKADEDGYFPAPARASGWSCKRYRAVIDRRSGRLPIVDRDGHI